MEACEVIIVGGGPAGSSCAWKLGRAGIDVVVLDKHQFPRHKVCAGWVTPPVLEELELDAAHYQQQAVLQPITRFITGLMDGPEIETVYHRIVSYGIRRCEFDDYLLRRTNAKLRLGEAFRSLRREGTDWIVNEELRAHIVIGAGGHFCPVARQFSKLPDVTQASEIIDSTQQPTVVAQEVEFEMTEDQQRHCSIQPDRPELFFCPDLKGYGWVFRKGNFVNIGLGREGEVHLSNHVAAFVQCLAARGKLTFDFTDRFRGHAYHLRTVLPQTIAEDDILLIGDAAGLAERQSGEGIRPAIESGLLAASTIIEADGRYGPEVGANYANKLRARFDASSSSSPTNWVPSVLRLFAARWLMTSRWFARSVLLDRWFLHASQPPLRA